MKVKLGERYRDIVTGFEGVATSATEYLNGCRRIGLEKLDEKGEKVITLVFDEPNLESLPERGVRRAPRSKPRRVTGGPHDHGSVVDAHA